MTLGPVRSFRQNNEVIVNIAESRRMPSCRQSFFLTRTSHVSPRLLPELVRGWNLQQAHRSTLFRRFTTGVILTFHRIEAFLYKAVRAIVLVPPRDFTLVQKSISGGLLVKWYPNLATPWLVGAFSLQVPNLVFGWWEWR